MSWIRILGLYLGTSLTLIHWIGCEDPSLPIGDLTPDESVGGIGPISIVGGESEGGREIGGSLYDAQADSDSVDMELDAGDETDREAGMVGGDESGTDVIPWEMSSCATPLSLSSK